MEKEEREKKKKCRSLKQGKGEVVERRERGVAQKGKRTASKGGI